MLQEIPTEVSFQSKCLLRTGLYLSTGMEKNDTHPPFAWELDLSFCGYGFGKKTSELKENDDTSYMETHSLGMLILLIRVLGYPLKMCLREGVVSCFLHVGSWIPRQRKSKLISDPLGGLYFPPAQMTTPPVRSAYSNYGVFDQGGYQETLDYLVNEAHSPSFWNREIHVLQRPSYMQVPQILAHSLWEREKGMEENSWGMSAVTTQEQQLSITEPLASYFAVV